MKKELEIILKNRNINLSPEERAIVLQDATNELEKDMLEEMFLLNDTDYIYGSLMRHGFVPDSSWPEELEYPEYWNKAENYL